MEHIVGELIAQLNTSRVTTSVGGGEWAWIGENQRAGYLESIDTADTEKLSGYLLNPLSMDTAYGLITPVDMNAPSDARSNDFQKDLETYKDSSGTHQLEDLVHPILLPHPFESFTQEFCCYPDSPRHAYSAKRINGIIGTSGVGLEIGGGYGGLLYYLNKFGYSGKLINCDLVETLLIAYIFLRVNGIAVKLCLTTEDYQTAFESNAKVLLITPEVLDKLSVIDNLQFVFNSRSLSEMARSQSTTYLSQINENFQPKLVFLENAEWVEYPDSIRHVEVTQDEFAAQLSNYRLMENSKSKFMGGAGRYSERIYLLK
jgi:hypothetical protein